MPVSGLILRTALTSIHAVGRQMRPFDELAAGANGALTAAPPGLTPAGCAAFLATQAQESDYFRSTVEYGGRTADYAPHWGRTFEMITWETNYRRFGRWCHDRKLVDDPEVFVRNPAKLADYEWAWLGGTWYFEFAGLWPYANRGDFLAVSQGVNLGPKKIGSRETPRGWRDRLAMYDVLRAAGDALMPAPPPDTGGRRRRTSLLSN